MAFLQRILGLTELDGEQWLLVVGLAIALVLVDVVVKVFLRRALPTHSVSPGEG